jgi:hypothetical protein
LRRGDGVLVSGNLGTGFLDLGAVLVGDQLERHRVDRRQQVALCHCLVVDDADRDDPSADLRRHGDQIGPHVGV